MQPKAKSSLLTLVIVAGLVAAFFVFRGENDSPRKLSRDDVDHIKKAYETKSQLEVQEVAIRDLVYLVYKPSVKTRLGNTIDNLELNKLETYGRGAKYVLDQLRKRRTEQMKMTEPELETLWTNHSTISSFVDLKSAKITCKESANNMIDKITVTVGKPQIDQNKLVKLDGVGLHPETPKNDIDMQLYKMLLGKVEQNIKSNICQLVNNDDFLFDDSAKLAAECAIRAFSRKILPGVEVVVEFKDTMDSKDM